MRPRDLRLGTLWPMVPAVAALALPSVGHDVALTEAQRDAIERAVIVLRPGLDVERLKRVDRILRDFTTRELEGLATVAELRKLGGRETLLRAAWSIAFVRIHGREVRELWRIGLLLGSARRRDWQEGIRLLRRRPFDAGLERIAVALAVDPRPEVRLAAGRLAKTLVVFGHRSKNLERVAQRLLVDPVPNVAALFAAHDAHDFRSREIMDLMVARLHDERALLPMPDLLEGTGKVSDYVLTRLRNEFFWWRSETGMARRFSPKPSLDAVAAWWRKHRDTFRSGPDPASTRMILDWTGVCRLEKKTEVRTADGPVWIEVISYREHWLGEKPVYSALLELWVESEKGDWVSLGGGGPNNAEQAEAVRSEGWGAGSPRRWVEYHIAPWTASEVRLRLMMWVESKG